MGTTRTTTTKKKPSAKTTSKKTVKTPVAKPEASEKTRKKLEKTVVFPIAIDFCGVKLNARQSAFLTYYLTPGDICYRNALKSAKKAGYANDTASVTIYQFLRKKEIQDIIKVNEDLVRQIRHDEAERAREIKRARANYDPFDFFEIVEVFVETKNGGYNKEVLKWKPKEELTEIQRMCVDGADVKGQAGTPVYILPNRTKELDDIIKEDENYRKLLGNNDGQDVDELREVIIERVTLRQIKRASADPKFHMQILDRGEGVGEEL